MYRLQPNRTGKQHGDGHLNEAQENIADKFDFSHDRSKQQSARQAAEHTYHNPCRITEFFHMSPVASCLWEVLRHFAYITWLLIISLPWPTPWKIPLTMPVRHLLDKQMTFGRTLLL